MRIAANYTRYNTEDLEKLIAYTYELCKAGGVRRKLYNQGKGKTGYGPNLHDVMPEFLDAEWTFSDYGRCADHSYAVKDTRHGPEDVLVRIVKPEELWSNTIEALSYLSSPQPILPRWALAEMVHRFSTWGTHRYSYYNRSGLRGDQPWSIEKCFDEFAPPDVRIMPKPEEKKPKGRGGQQRRSWLDGAANSAKQHLWLGIHPGHNGGKYASNFVRGGYDLKKALVHAKKTKDPQLVQHIQTCIDYHERIESAVRALMRELNEVPGL
jgi:hypothetical protein